MLLAFRPPLTFLPPHWHSRVNGKPGESLGASGRSAHRDGFLDSRSPITNVGDRLRGNDRGGQGRTERGRKAGGSAWEGPGEGSGCYGHSGSPLAAPPPPHCHSDPHGHSGFPLVIPVSTGIQGEDQASPADLHTVRAFLDSRSPITNVGDRLRGKDRGGQGRTEGGGKARGRGRDAPGISASHWESGLPHCHSRRLAPCHSCRLPPVIRPLSFLLAAPPVIPAVFSGNPVEGARTAGPPLTPALSRQGRGRKKAGERGRGKELPRERGREKAQQGEGKLQTDCFFNVLPKLVLFLVHPGFQAREEVG